MLLAASDLIPYIINRKGSRNRYIIGIDRPGASGKSCLADQILAQMSDIQIVHFDDFYLGNDAADTKLTLGSRFDWARLEQQVLLPLSNNQKAYYQVYDWQLQKLGKWKTVMPNGIVIVEGVYSTRSELRHYYDLTVFVTANYETRLQRGIDRDGISSRDKWMKEWMPEEIMYIESEHDPRGYAEVEIDGEKIAT